MSTIKLKRSAVAGKVPATSDLGLGEVALNTYDGRIYVKKSVGGTESIVTFSGSTASENNVHAVAYTGNGTIRAYSMPAIPKGNQYISVYLNGVLQHITEYSFSGQVLTFNDAPLTSDAIEIRIYDALVASVTLRDFKTFTYTFNSSQTVGASEPDAGTVAAAAKAAAAAERDLDPPRLKVGPHNLHSCCRPNAVDP
jgi:hypothetical protein